MKILDLAAISLEPTHKRDRFIIETNKVIELQDDIEGIIPIYEYSLPDKNMDNLYWYTMPVAVTVNEYFADKKDIEEILKCILQLSCTLVQLHEQDIVHRDIKPSNIYFYKDNYCLADFGLVDYPNKDDLTRETEQVGAKATIATEMKRNANNADGKKADVYSLAKTLWMLLTESKFGFDGTYNSDSELMRIENKYPKEHLVELSQLLIDSTQDEPALRPTMEEFSVRLSEYFNIRQDFEKSNLSQWQFIQKKLFKDFVPESAYWKEREDIVKVMNLLGSMPGLNHMFISTGGGLDFDFAELAQEEGCIALHAGSSVDIVKPSMLIVENIKKDFKWSYFRLELDKLEATGISDITGDRELVTEHIPGKYISWVCGNYGYYENDNPLPEGYRIVTRYLTGSFVFFSKASVYNEISNTYDARHNFVNGEEYRLYIETLRDDYNKLGKRSFMQIHSENPFDDRKVELGIDTKREFEKEFRVKPIIKEYLTTTDFSPYFETEGVDGDNSALHFSVEVRIDESFLSPQLELCSDGRFRESNTIFGLEKNGNKLFRFRNLDVVRKFIELVNIEIKKICNGDLPELLSTVYYFSIEPMRNKRPTHLFTKEEIKVVLSEGNDHVDNMLVIDGNGYPKLIEKPESYGLYTRQYPVIHETYGAYNNYVGKYSDLNHLDDEYISSLQGWLRHLESDGCIRMDYVHKNNDEEELLKQLSIYY